jgi:flavorubredoxin
MPKALIVCSTRTGETRKIGELIAEGLRFSMVDVTIKDATEIKKETDLAGYDAYVFGSSTYHGEMMNSMKTMLFLAEKAGLKDRKGGAFGSYGWSGEAAERIFETMKNIYGMAMVNSPLMLKSATVEGGMKMAQNYGREVAAAIG